MTFAAAVIKGACHFQTATDHVPNELFLGRDQLEELSLLVGADHFKETPSNTKTFAGLLVRPVNAKNCLGFGYNDET